MKKEIFEIARDIIIKGSYSIKTVEEEKVQEMISLEQTIEYLANNVDEYLILFNNQFIAYHDGVNAVFDKLFWMCHLKKLTMKEAITMATKIYNKKHYGTFIPFE